MLLRNSFVVDGELKFLLLLHKRYENVIARVNDTMITMGCIESFTGNASFSFVAFHYCDLISHCRKFAGVF